MTATMWLFSDTPPVEAPAGVDLGQWYPVGPMNPDTREHRRYVRLMRAVDPATGQAFLAFDSREPGNGRWIDAGSGPAEPADIAEVVSAAIAAGTY